MILRPMEESDGVWMAEWEQSNRPYPWTRDHFLGSHRSWGGRVLIAEINGEPAGFVVVQREAEEAYIQNLMVDPAHRRQGWGSFLFQALEEWCLAQGIQKLKLEVDIQNKPAVSLYKKQGYQVLAKRPGAYPHGETAWVMEKVFK